MEVKSHYTFVIIGGGIAGVTCAETLASLNSEIDILLITKSNVVKVVSSAINLTRTLTSLNIQEANPNLITDKFTNIRILRDSVTSLNYTQKTIQTQNNGSVGFEKLCVCTGGRPKLIDETNPLVLGIRDTESVVEFQKRIAGARRLMIVGNGGIASEIVHEVQGIEKIWVIKDDHVSKTFIDAGAGEFLKSHLDKGEDPGATVSTTAVKRLRYSAEPSGGPSMMADPALGPDWHRNFHLKGGSAQGKITIEFTAQVARMLPGDDEWPLCVELTNGRLYGVDLVVSATGVLPNSDPFTDGNEGLQTAADGGILVDWKMESSLRDVFAAGDVATAGWEWAPHWHQMRLWTQARQMGFHAAKCLDASLKNEPIFPDFAFDIFAHVTKLYGFKVVLLGLFNGQNLGNDYELLLRMTKGVEYVKLVIKEGRLQGALLIGETDLEETCENLILNQLDITPFGDDLLNPDIDIEDYFD